MADKALRTYGREPRRAGSSSAERGSRGEGHLCFLALPPRRGTGEVLAGEQGEKGILWFSRPIPAAQKQESFP